jgi:hypothetical protein
MRPIAFEAKKVLEQFGRITRVTALKLDEPAATCQLEVLRSTLLVANARPQERLQDHNSFIVNRLQQPGPAELVRSSQTFVENAFV